MKRLNDLLSGKEKIKVDSIESAGDITVADSVLITIDGGNNARFMGTTEGVCLVDAYDNILTINDSGLSFNWGETIAVFTCDNSEFRMYKPLTLKGYTTALRPAAYEGSIIYDSTLKKCILYNGTAWVNLDGTALS